MYEESFDFAATSPDLAAMGSYSSAGPLMAIMGMMWIIVLVFYVYSALCWFYIAKRTNTPNGWFAFIPILNTLLMLNVAKRPWWWLFLFLIPLVNFVLAIITMIDVMKALSRPGWWVIMQFIPVVNLVFLGLMAWGKTEKIIPQTTVIPPAPQK